MGLQFLCAYLFDTGEHDKAFPLYQRLERLSRQGDLDDRCSYRTFGVLFLKHLRRTRTAGRCACCFERVLELNPTLLASLGAGAPLYFATQAWKKAENAYRQLLQLTGGQGDRKAVAEMYTQLGLVERELGNDVKGYKRFNKALEIVPNHIEALRGMALILEDRQDWSTLLNVYNNVIYHATEPRDVTYAYINKGRVLDESMSRPDKAAQHYERSLAFEERQAESYLRLAELAMRRMDYAEAGALADKGLSHEDASAGVEAGLKLAKAASLQFDAQHDAGQQMVGEAIQRLRAHRRH